MQNAGLSRRLRLLARTGCLSSMPIKRGLCESCKDEAIQYRRAHLVAEYAPVAVSDCKSASEREIAVRKLLQLARNHVDRRCLIPMNGAALAAEAILSILD